MTKFEGPAPQQKIEGADRVLGSMLIKVDSGNLCICTPGITGNRAVMYLVWKGPATKGEIEEVFDFLASLGMPRPEVVGTHDDPNAATNWATAYLKKGKQ